MAHLYPGIIISIKWLLLHIVGPELGAISQWNVVVHKETFPDMYRLLLYHNPMIAKILQQTEKWGSSVTMDM